MTTKVVFIGLRVSNGRNRSNEVRLEILQIENYQDKKQDDGIMISKKL